MPNDLTRRSRADDEDPSRRLPTHRDRDRILYSEAFRRLGGVTQVAVGSPEMSLHNRLTHSLKVEQVGLSLYSRLVGEGHIEHNDADQYAVAAACLAHDLGHPPFGHAGEEELNALVTCDEHRRSARPFDQRVGNPCNNCKLEDGFEGNAQSFRIITSLAVHKESYLGSPPTGLDLTLRTLRATTKYPWGRGDNPDKPKKWGAYDCDLPLLRELTDGDMTPTLNAQIMDWADDISYATHDVEDFYRTGHIPLGDYTEEDGEPLRAFFEFASAPSAAGDFGPEVKEAFANLLVFVPRTRYLGSEADLATLDNTRGVLLTSFINAASVVEGILQRNRTQATLNKVVKQLIWYHVIENPQLANIQLGQRRVLREIFDSLEQVALSTFRVESTAPRDDRELRRLPAGLRRAVELGERQASPRYNLRQIVYRGLLDYISGLSDLEAYQQHSVLRGVERVGHL